LQQKQTDPFGGNHPIRFARWREADASAFKRRWPDFSPEEIACRGDGSLLIDPPAMDKLQALRSLLGKPVIVTSGYRTPEHNEEEGGEPGSLHLQARAFDISFLNHDPAELEAAARKVGFTGFGRYPARGIIHVDTGRPRWWGAKEWPASTRQGFQPSPPPVREDIAKSRTVRASGVVTLSGGAAIAAVAADALKVFEPLQPLLDWIRSNPTGTLWVIGIALILIGLYFAAARLDDWAKLRR